MVDAAMLYAIKLGPLETGEGPIAAYVGFTETGALRPVLGLKDGDGLAQLAAQAQGHELRCERGLLRAGKLGFAAAPLPDWARAGRATLAFGLSGSGQRGVRNLDVVECFLASVAAFSHAAPWRFWCDSEPLAVTISTASAKEYEGCIMGCLSKHRPPLAGDAASPSDSAGALLRRSKSSKRPNHGQDAIHPLL
jgi:hypothetical protein